MYFGKHTNNIEAAIAVHATNAVTRISIQPQVLQPREPVSFVSPPLLPLTPSAQAEVVPLLAIAAIYSLDKRGSHHQETSELKLGAVALEAVGTPKHAGLPHGITQEQFDKQIVLSNA